MLENVMDGLEKVRRHRRVSRLRHNERTELPDSFPELQLESLRDDLPAIEAEYRPHHAAYTSGVSDALNAVSLRQAALLAWLIRTQPVTRVLDTGSGFSTYVLRREAQRRPDVIHCAVEDNTYWLDRSRDYLRKQTLPSDNVFSWDQFTADKSLANFDLVFHDMGNMTTRLISLPELESRLAPHAWLILDDMHKSNYDPHARQHLGERWTIQSLVDLTLDECGRFACICRRRALQS